MEEQYFYTYLNSPVGFLKLTSNDVALTAVSFSEERGKNSLHLPDVLIQAAQQLEKYFEGNRLTFNLNMAPVGTEFQQKVWELVKKVPFGETASYLEIARLTGSSNNTRAVGLANGKNPIPIIIPCHRIIGTNGKLTGYAGGIERKRWLLQHEMNHTDSTKRLF
jgi:methylated-DNA-[protein]-cysteine S-methyltransferase